MIKRTSPIKRSPLPQRRTPIAKINATATAKRGARRKKERSSPEEKDARKAGWLRANGICECGECSLPFGLDAHTDDSPEWHHPTTSAYWKHVGVWLRRHCHQRIEARDFGHRQQRRRATA